MPANTRRIVRIDVLAPLFGEPTARVTYYGWSDAGNANMEQEEVLTGFPLAQAISQLAAQTTREATNPASSTPQGAEGAPCHPLPPQDGTEAEQGGGLKSQTPEALEPALGVAFAQSPNQGGGSNGNDHGAAEPATPPSEKRPRRGIRAMQENHAAEDSMVSERVLALVEPADGSVYGPRLGGGWFEIRSKGDPGTGIYRWSVGELPNGCVLNAFLSSDPTASIDCFGADLEAARAALARDARLPIEKLQNMWPVAHRPTRLCRAARRARGEI